MRSSWVSFCTLAAKALLLCSKSPSPRTNTLFTLTLQQVRYLHKVCKSNALYYVTTVTYPFHHPLKVDCLVVYLCHVSSIDHIHDENCWGFLVFKRNCIQTAQYVKAYTQFVSKVTYEIQILNNSKISHHYFLRKLYDGFIDWIILSASSDNIYLYQRLYLAEPQIVLLSDFKFINVYWHTFIVCFYFLCKGAGWIKTKTSQWEYGQWLEYYIRLSM